MPRTPERRGFFARMRDKWRGYKERRRIRRASAEPYWDVPNTDYVDRNPTLPDPDDKPQLTEHDKRVIAAADELLRRRESR